MANTKSAKKRIRSREKKRDRNRIHRGRARSQVRKARIAIEHDSLDDAQAAVIAAVKALDHAASKGTIHKNNAARRKSRLMKRLAALEASSK